MRGPMHKVEPLRLVFGKVIKGFMYGLLPVSEFICFDWEGFTDLQ